MKRSGSSEHSSPMYLPFITFIIAVVPFILSGCGTRQVEAVVERRDITAYLPLDGKIYAPAASQAGIKSPYEAPVQKVYVTIGQSVKKGEVIVQLSAPSDQAYYQQARQRLQTAENQLAQAQKQWNASIKAAKTQVIQAQQAEQAARKAAQTPQTTEIPGGGSVQVTGGNQEQLTDATATRQAAEQNLEDLIAQRDQALVVYEQQVSTAQQEFADAQAGLKSAMIRTPISGTVLDINISSGQTVAPDQKEPIATIVDLQALKVYSPVDKDQLTQVTPNLPAVVTLNDFPKDKMEGQITHVYTRKAGLLQNTEYVAVTEFDNAKGEAKPGMDAVSSVLIGTVKNVLTVPAGAVYETGDKKAVKVRVGKEWRERIVESGLSDGKYTEIKSGLKEGEVVQVPA